MFNKKLNPNGRYELLEVNLQLFADDAAHDGQSGVVDRVNSDDSSKSSNIDNDDESFDDWDEEELPDDDGEEGSKDSELADPDKPKQSPEENKIMQKARIKYEAEIKAKYEADRIALEEEKKAIEEQRKEIEKQNIINKHYANITQDKIEKLAYDKGIDETIAREILIRDAQLAANYEINENKRNADMYRLKKESYQNKPYFKAIENQVDQYMRQNPGTDIEIAYKYYLGELIASGKIDDIVKQEKTKTQKQTIADIHDRSRRRGISGGDASNEDVIEPSKILDRESLAMTLAFQNDPREIAKVVKSKMKRR